MSVILVVEQDAGYANRIANALRSTGHVVNVVPNLDAAQQSAGLQPPQLVLASGSLPGAVELLEKYSQRRGGPGAIVLLPVTLASQVQAADFRADEVLAKPYSDQDLFALSGKLLAASGGAPQRPAPRGQLTSADIFGDVLAEVEAEAQKAQAKKPLFAADDIEKKLEETLSGVLATGDRLLRPGATPAPPRPAAPAPTAAPRPMAAPGPPQAMPPAAAAPPRPMVAPGPPQAAPGAMPPMQAAPRPPAPIQAAPMQAAPMQAAPSSTAPLAANPNLAQAPRPAMPAPAMPIPSMPPPAAPPPRPAAAPTAGAATAASLGLPFPQAGSPPPRRPQASAREIDDLLDKTLSSLELPQRAAKRPGMPGQPGAMPAMTPPPAAPPPAAAPAALRMPPPAAPAPIAPAAPMQAAPMQAAPMQAAPMSVAPPTTAPQTFTPSTRPTPQPSFGTLPVQPSFTPAPGFTPPSFRPPQPTAPAAPNPVAAPAPSPWQQPAFGAPPAPAAAPSPTPALPTGSDLMTVALPKAALAALVPGAWIPNETPPPLAPSADLRGEPLEAWSPPSFATSAFEPGPLPDLEIPEPNAAFVPEFVAHDPVPPEPLIPAEAPAFDGAGDAWSPDSFDSAFPLEADLYPSEPVPPQATEAFAVPSIATTFDAAPSFEPFAAAPSFEPFAVADPDPAAYASQEFSAGPDYSGGSAAYASANGGFAGVPEPVAGPEYGAGDFSGAWSVGGYEEPPHPIAEVGISQEPADFVSAFAPPPETGSFVRPLRLGDTGKISTADFGLGNAEADQGLQAALQGVLQMRGHAGDHIDAELEGTPFGEYRLLERVALGGMAEVWRARRRGVEGFQKTVAIKKILSHLTGSADFITMFIDEAKLAAQLSHNNIIQIYDLGKVDDDFYIAMEYVEGKDLRSILSASRDQRTPLPLPLALMIIAAVARALDYAHRKRDFSNRALGLVHRDVSPQNVLISYEGEIKLCDFGIVKAVAKASTTQMGALKGKLQYMSPEQAWGRDVDARSDIFSLGSVMFEVLTGTKLFTGDSEIGVLDAVRDCRLRSPRDIVPTIPEEIERIVRKALAKNPEDRYSTAGQLEKEIMAALDGLRLAPTQRDVAEHMHHLFQTAPAPKPPALDISLPHHHHHTSGAHPAMSGTRSAAVRTHARPPAPESSSRTLLIVGIVVALLALVALALWLTRDTGTPEEIVPTPAAAPGTGAEPDPEALVREAVSEKQKQLKEDYEKQKKALEEQIDQTKQPPKPPPPRGQNR